MDLEQDRSLVLDEVYRVYVEFGPNALVKVSEIAEQLDLDRLAMEKALHWLAGHGYIEWSSTGDAVTITASGVDAIEQVRQRKTAARTKLSERGTELMEMKPDFRRHILALLELGMKYSENAGLTETRLSELEQHLSLSRGIMREAIKYLGERGAVRIIVDDPNLPYGVSQAFVTDTGRLYYHELLEESQRPIEEPYVFISHSSKDSTVVSAVKQAFQDLPLKLYFAEDKPRGAPPSREFVRAVKNAEALFVFFTHNSIIGDTRDWIVYEIGVAVGHDRPVYSWKERYLTKEQLPKLLEQVSIHREFELSGDGTIRLTGEIRDAAKNL